MLSLYGHWSDFSVPYGWHYAARRPTCHGTLRIFSDGISAKGSEESQSEPPAENDIEEKVRIVGQPKEKFNEGIQDSLEFRQIQVSFCLLEAH